jgi:hypothetical protein
MKSVAKKQRRHEMMFRKIYNLKQTPNSKIKLILNDPKKSMGPSLFPLIGGVACFYENKKGRKESKK